MTKVTILGNEPNGHKKIEFIECAFSCSDKIYEPSYYGNVRLLERNHKNLGLDLFAAWDSGSRSSAFYLGHFNDGVV